VPDPAFRSLSVPGNLLLAGEYAVLVEGGLGLACAVERRVRVTWQPSDTLKIRALFEDQSILWTPQGSASLPLLDQLWDILLARYGSLVDLRFTLTLDSTDLARKDGRKSGLGSSAAAVVAAYAALCYLATGAPPRPEDVFEAALTAHRRAQGNQGSGYDLACSSYGGLGLFRAGKIPSWTPLPQKACPAFTLLSAPRPVSTGQAIRQWDQWQQSNPADWSQYLRKSQQLVSSLALAQDRASFTATLARAAALGQHLGQQLGVWDPVNAAFLATQAGPLVCKALGAGNELLARSCAEHDPARVSLSAKGLQWC
jgi:phosphomevalonate kinase